MVVAGLKFFPFTLSEKEAPPAFTVFGEIDVMAGCVEVDETGTEISQTLLP